MKESVLPFFLDKIAKLLFWKFLNYYNTTKSKGLCADTCERKLECLFIKSVVLKINLAFDWSISDSFGFWV